MKYKTLQKLWGAAFDTSPKQEAVMFASGRDTQGLPPSDEALIPYEIAASSAYVKGLYDEGLINAGERKKLLASLDKLKSLWTKGKFHIDPEKEDVHTNIESWLTDELGPEIAGKIHTGRSRNEQSIINILLYLNDTNIILLKEIECLITVLEKKSVVYAKSAMPGYTHHRKATATTFGAVLDAYAQEFKKDLGQFSAWVPYAMVSPLGSAAGYGTTLPINKHAIVKHLGIPKTFANPIGPTTFKGDAEALFIFNIVMFMNHLSMLAQTLILFSTEEFGFVTLADMYTTGSSIMPQKKNPDILEVMKAKASMCQGYLMSLLGIMKASFVGYNRDSQWLKYLVMDAIGEVKSAPTLMAQIVDTLKFHEAHAETQAGSGFILAQAVMEGLITDYKLPMRLAKTVTESAVKFSKKEGKLTSQKVQAALDDYGVHITLDKKKFNGWMDVQRIVSKQLKMTFPYKKRHRRR